MIIPILEDEIVFLDYLDDQSADWGFKLVDDAPIEAKEALSSYLSRAERIRKPQEVE